MTVKTEGRKYPPFLFLLLIPSLFSIYSFDFFLTKDNKQPNSFMFHPPPLPFFPRSVLFSQVPHLPLLCVIFSLPLCTFSTLVIVKHRLTIVSVPPAPPPPPHTVLLCSLLSLRRLSAVPLPTSFHSCTFLF